jgi:bacterioferritin-associated ferredoxin
VVVCHCTAVNDARLRAEIAAGAVDAEDLAERCGAGSRCGGCYETVVEILRQHRTVAAA